MYVYCVFVATNNDSIKSHIHVLAPTTPVIQERRLGTKLYLKNKSLYQSVFLKTFNTHDNVNSFQKQSL